MSDTSLQPLESILAPASTAAPASDVPCCGPQSSPTPASDPMAQPFVRGRLDTSVGPIPMIDSALTKADHWGTIKVRWGWRRMDYRVQPGLYALNQPREDSPVLVTANYKLSLDSLRAALPGRPAWILVLDTHGVNVWCAAGKGTMGTEELVKRIRASRLEQLVSHRRVILPQLAGPGVAAYKVKKQTGFSAGWGPVMARDLPAFLDGGAKATPAMRRKEFPWRERLALVPMELVEALKQAVLPAFLLLLLAGILGPGGFWSAALRHGLPMVAFMAGGILAGAVIAPWWLPWLPGRAFSLKSVWPGLGVGLLLAAWFREGLGTGIGEAMAGLLLGICVASFLAMNFTGASTYTSLSGVKQEMRWAVPMQILGGLTGLVLWALALVGI